MGGGRDAVNLCNPTLKQMVSAASFGKLLFVITVLANTPFSRFQNLLYLDRGLDAAHVGTLQLTLVFKAVGWLIWGIIADTIGLKYALIVCIILSTLALEPFRWQIVFDNFALLFLVKSLRTFLNAAYPLVDGVALKASQLTNYSEIRLWGSLSFGLGFFC